MMRRVCPVGRCRAAPTPGLSVTVPPCVAKCGARQPFRPALPALWGGGGLGIASSLCEGRRFMGLRTAPLMAAAAGTDGPSSAGGNGPVSDASLLGPFSPSTPLFFARLYLAARDGDIAAVNALLADDKGKCVWEWQRTTDTNNVGVLCIAVQYGRLEVVKALLAAGLAAGTKLRDNDGLSPLLAAVRGQRTPIMEVLIAAGASVNAHDVNGASPLSFAVEVNNFDMVKALLAANADPNGCLFRRDERPWKSSPLMKAVQRGNLPIVEALLAAKADPNLRGEKGSTPLHEAARHRGIPFAITKALLAARSDVNAVTDEGETALSLATRTGNADALEALIAAKADVNQCAPIVAAAFHGRSALVGRLLSLGADTNSVSKCTVEYTNYSSDYDYTPLTAAINQQHDAIVEMLLAAKANPNGRAGRYGHRLGYQSPLLAAIGVGRLDYVTALLKAGADVNAVIWYDPPLIAASKGMGNLPIVRALIASGADVNMRHRHDSSTALIVAENPEVAQALIDAGADLNAYDQHGGTPLMRHFSRPEVWKVLIAAGADVNFNQGELLWKAVNNGDLSSVQILLASGADVSLHNSFKRTALHQAARNGHADVIKALIAAGADMDAKDYEGKTPAQVAADNKQPAAVAALAAASASAGASSGKPQTSKNATSKPRQKKTSRK